jgi:FAD-linked sulfhydryl oxidase
MGYSPSLWGREGWHLIHYITLNYPQNPTDQDKKLYQQFFEFLPQVLPCPFCGNHFIENMAKNPIRLENTRSLFEWGVDMHNAVNESNGMRLLSYEEALEQINLNSSRGRFDSEILNHNRVSYLLNRVKKLK